MLFLNLLFLDRKSSLDGGGGLSAIVGANKDGSLSFKGTLRVTLLASSFRNRSTLAISTGMYWYCFFTFTTFEFHSLVLWLYFLYTTTSPALVVAAALFTWKFQSVAANCFLAL